ncbi:MAG: hypothetical protein IKO77_00625 [Bacteroidales bacterium]|nr:hypothetical protein [Bacteroidales bacterium]
MAVFGDFWGFFYLQNYTPRFYNGQLPGDPAASYQHLQMLSTGFVNTTGLAVENFIKHLYNYI